MRSLHYPTETQETYTAVEKTPYDIYNDSFSMASISIISYLPKSFKGPICNNKME